jgi:hypothetical protein
VAFFYNSHSGEEFQESGALGDLQSIEDHLGLGWHEYATQADVLAAVKANGWPAPTTSATTGLGNDASGAAKDVTSGATSALTGLFPQFTNTRDFTSRAIRVVAGLMLLGIGLNMLVKESTGISPVKTAAKVAAL